MLGFHVIEEELLLRDRGCGNNIFMIDFLLRGNLDLLEILRTHRLRERKRRVIHETVVEAESYKTISLDFHPLVRNHPLEVLLILHEFRQIHQLVDVHSLLSV